MAIEIPEFATVKEGGRIARRSDWTIRAWLTKGVLKRYKVGRGTLIRVDELLALIKPEDAAAATARNVEKVRKATAARKAARHSQKPKVKP